MKCFDCPHFKIQYKPIKAKGGGYWDFGRAKCEKHLLIVDFSNNGQLKKLQCVEEVSPELVLKEKKMRG